MTSINTHVKRNKDDGVPIVENIRSFQTNENPSLVKLLFQFGRYLLISSSRSETQVAKLQGVWNEDLEPLFDFIKSLSVNENKVARVNYKISGWVVHHKSDIWAKPLADKEEVVWGIWPMGLEVDSQSYAGASFIQAAGHGQQNALKVLLECHANPNSEIKDGVSLLLSSITASSLTCLELLVQVGADVNFTTDRATPLHIDIDIGKSMSNWRSNS
ncbi:unnamed protein product [Dovyalis caffra]|uniref:Glycosyl hydrolase family 95 catalytic domain-containing protein n=1 Tax=Dovyalis caffra TaxID=77055 RepID=A0AAV1S394_9ROSI|nr:unnamed protein product [Dovyalis caffra]